MRPHHDLQAERLRRRRRQYAVGLRQAALHADERELEHLEQLVAAEHAGCIILSDAHDAVNALLREHTERRR